MFVQAFKMSNYRSELLYLMEPHILKCLRGLSANKTVQITSFYINLRQGSDEFLQQMVAYSALICQHANFRSVMELLKCLKTKQQFYRAVMVLIENGIVPNIDQLHIRDVYQVLIALIVHKIGKEIYYELLATEYVRKH